MGPASVAPGATAQFTAIAHRADGTTADVTSTANWRSSRPSVLTVTPTGLVTGQAAGEANIHVTTAVAAMREVVVVPSGTYRLVGLVAEADSPTTPVIGAVVEVMSGGLPLVSALTALDGRYRLYGVPDHAEIRVTKAGYQPLTRALSLSDNQMENFTLALTTARVNLAGTYTLTISAPAECHDKLPQEVWMRRYTATVRQTGPLLDVSLAGANFVVDDRGKGGGFRGRIEPAKVVFTIDYDFYYRMWFDIIEELNPSLYFGVYGSVAAAATPGNISGALNGTFYTVVSNPRTAPAHHRFCNSTVHQLVLQR